MAEMALPDYSYQILRHRSEGRLPYADYNSNCVLFAGSRAISCKALGRLKQRKAQGPQPSALDCTTFQLEDSNAYIGKHTIKKLNSITTTVVVSLIQHMPASQFSIKYT
jgi:hypothetical protein